ncbi:gamma-glutamyltranspeptidase [Cladochytrium replicatum]|nr:gamma-glutamyltranspeptidase [Cladochytrium replicatum]
MSAATNPFNSRRSPVYSRYGIVATSQPLATEAGLEILRKGGNAVDAAVAAAAALNVTEPGSTGIGGDMFLLFYNAKDKSVKGLNASGRAPGKLTLDYAKNVLGLTGSSIPASNINSVTVPGAAQGWYDSLKYFGSGKLTLEDVLAPAIRIAEDGFPVSDISALQWIGSEKLLKEASENGGEMLLDGKAPRTGEIMRNPTLAQTFRTLAKEGRDGFYKGRIADEIIALVASKGGVMTHEDLANHTSTLVDPVSIDYDDKITLHECPPNGQGIVALQALGIIEALQNTGRIPRLGTGDMVPGNPKYVHVIIEALRLAFADANAFVADPEKVNVPVQGMIDKEYLKKRSELINLEKATVDPVEGSPKFSTDTVYFATSDTEGNACSFIISNYMGFGTGAIPKGCGFTLQNRGSNFVLTPPTHPNVLAPNKRPYHTIIPAMATYKSSNDLYLSFGVMGGFMQPQGHLQVLLNLYHHGDDPQRALDAPRLCLHPTMDTQGGAVQVEEGIVGDVEELRKMGHHVVVLNGWGRQQVGRGQVIERKVVASRGKEGGEAVWVAGSDPRADGFAGALI